jgi:hypothetical protein
MDEPTQPAEPTAEARWSRGFAGYFVWPVVIVLMYVLSSGPAGVLLLKKKVSSGSMCGHILNYFYTPWGWAYENTPLHKPLGMYMHLWCPDQYGANGEYR